MLDLRRRQFITLLGGAAVAWPVTASAQKAERERRIGVLMHLPENDPEAQARIRALLRGMQQLGWTEGLNLRIDYRFGAADVDRARGYAAEPIALAPDVHTRGPASIGLPGPALRCGRRSRLLRP